MQGEANIFIAHMYTCTIHIHVQQALVVFSFKATQKIISCVTAACALFSKNGIELKSLHMSYVQYLQILTILARLKSVVLSCHEYVVHTTSPNTYTHSHLNTLYTCAERLMVSRLNTAGSSFCNTPWATEVLPVPTGPTSRTGLSTIMRWCTRKS